MFPSARSAANAKRHHPGAKNSAEPDGPASLLVSCRHTRVMPMPEESWKNAETLGGGHDPNHQRTIQIAPTAKKTETDPEVQSSDASAN